MRDYSHLENVLQQMSDIIPSLLESGPEYGCLIILDRDAVQFDMGEAPYPNELAIRSLATASALQRSDSWLSVTSIDPLSRTEAAAIRAGDGMREAWGWSGGTRAEALGILSFLLFISKRMDAHRIFRVAGDYPYASRIIETFNTLRGPAHIPLPEFVTPAAANIR